MANDIKTLRDAAKAGFILDAEQIEAGEAASIWLWLPDEDPPRLALPGGVFVLLDPVEGTEDAYQVLREESTCQRCGELLKDEEICILPKFKIVDLPINLPPPIKAWLHLKEADPATAVTAEQPSFEPSDYAGKGYLFPLGVQHDYYCFCAEHLKEYFLAVAMDCPGRDDCPLVREDFPKGVEVLVTAKQPVKKPGDDDVTKDFNREAGGLGEAIEIPVEILRLVGGRPGEDVRVVITLSPSDYQDRKQGLGS